MWLELLADLHKTKPAHRHTAWQAAVKLGGEHGKWFDVGRGVWQGCVIAALLFNVFSDCVVTGRDA